MSFDPRTIEHLGIKMYSTLPPVISELVANSHDADAENVTISLIEKEGEKEIIVEDDGVGMTFIELNSKFLRIGRNRRYEEGEEKTKKGRKIIGKKGLGKLSFFGVAHEIKVSTKKGGKENSFKMNWEEIKNSKEPFYHPEILIKDGKCPSREKGTIITLSKIQRKSDFNPSNLATSLSKNFIVDPDFKISIQGDSGAPIIVTNERKYEDLDKEIEWNFPRDINLQSEYENKDAISGYLVSTKKPISPKTNMRGVTLFSRKKLVNAPEYFSEGISSHFFSYLTGWLEVDFIDDLDDDVILTNRQSLNWDHPETKKLRDYLSKLMNWLERDWREKRSNLRGVELGRKTGINILDWLNKLPQDIKEKIEPVMTAIFKDSEFPEETNKNLVKSLHYIVPEYPKLHWRHLHPSIKEMVEEDYTNKRYFDAAEKASRLYAQKVKEKSGRDTSSDFSDMNAAFNPDNGILKVTENNDTTGKNIQAGQNFLSQGVVTGCKNPLTHNPEYQRRLVKKGLFTEKDCLDMLSIISHLFRRLDNAKKR